MYSRTKNDDDCFDKFYDCFLLLYHVGLRPVFVFYKFVIVLIVVECRPRPRTVF